jgi:hypothetical protein
MQTNERNGEPPSAAAPFLLRDRANDLAERCRVLVRSATDAQKAAQRVPREATLATLSGLEQAAAQLRAAAANPGDLPEPLAAEALALAADLDTAAADVRDRGPRQFWLDLQAKCAQTGRGLTRIGDQPLRFRIGWLSFECDFERGDAQVLLGLEPIRTIRLSLDTIDLELAAFDRERSALPDGHACFDAIARAYRMTCVVAGVETGARVDLVDLLPHLAVLRSDPKKVRRQGVRALDDLPRYQLATMLARVRGERRLEQDGLRLELGSATGNSTKNKTGVLFVPTSERDGQYYLTIRFVPTGRPGATSASAPDLNLSEQSAPAATSPPPPESADTTAERIDLLGQQAFDALLDGLDSGADE